jgi:hypothetical protein
MPDEKYERLFGQPRMKLQENELQDKEMENNAKIGDVEKSNKSSMKKKNYGKGSEEETRALMKNGMADDSMIFIGNNKNKKKQKRD